MVMSVVFMTGCAGSLYEPTSENTRPGSNLGNLIAGKHLFESRCTQCHQIYLPCELNEDQWKEKLDEMQPRAEITNDEKSLIYQYVTRGARK
jgi:hypothetical protein